jgi:hypothetical protein
MPLAAGTRLGPNKTLAPIGAGDMGGRDVAAKISAERFSDRFSRESVETAHKKEIVHRDLKPGYHPVPIAGPDRPEDMRGVGPARRQFFGQVTTVAQNERAI